MGWFANTLERVKEITDTAPIDCPRGWGQVAFVSSVWVIPPMGGVQRNCPIGGVSSCGECTYASNPSAFRLSEHLAELRSLRDDGALSDSEYETRRGALIHLHPDPTGRGLYAAAWVLGPLGVLVTASGLALAATTHAGFLGLAAGGAVLLALSLSFWMLSRPARSAASQS